jgi:hypothetical protein
MVLSATNTIGHFGAEVNRISFARDVNLILYDGVTTDYDMQEKLVDGPNKWIQLGMPANKIGASLPFYGHIYLDLDGPGQPRQAFSRFNTYASALEAVQEVRDSLRVGVHGEAGLMVDRRCSRRAGLYTPT